MIFFKFIVSLTRMEHKRFSELRHHHQCICISCPILPQEINILSSILGRAERSHWHEMAKNHEKSGPAMR